jgi:hypothetical protein
MDMRPGGAVGIPVSPLFVISDFKWTEGEGKGGKGHASKEEEVI